MLLLLLLFCLQTAPLLYWNRPVVVPKVRFHLVPIGCPKASHSTINVCWVVQSLSQCCDMHVYSYNTKSSILFIQSQVWTPHPPLHMPIYNALCLKWPLDYVVLLVNWESQAILICNAFTQNKTVGETALKQWDCILWNSLTSKTMGLFQKSVAPIYIEMTLWYIARVVYLCQLC